ncbi:amidohydrolase family protein [Peribacillus simplex]|uniref:amidohydrolase family protein n=1 Tax=Peribacillus simplex TaxID=1478 RepID=UPI000B3149F3|nr:amidohydrolase family protein [Peribacillus simplex]
MIEQSEHLPFDFYFMMPYCVPATAFEHFRAALRSEDLISFYQNKKVIGLAEVMAFPDVSHAEEDMLQKLYDSNRLGKSIDCHLAGLSEQQLDVYMSAGIKTDHECTASEEAKE